MNVKRTDLNGHTRVGDVIREAGHKINDFSEHAGDRSDQLIHNAGDVIDKYQKDILAYSDTLAKYIIKKPLTSTLIAVGIGFIIGRLLRS